MHKQSKRYKFFRICVLLGVWIGLVPLAGCVAITNPTNGNSADNGSGDGFGNDGDGDPTDEILAVELVASNMNPQVGEEVFLTCTVISGDTNANGQAIDPLFDFQPSNRLIDIDTMNGSAIFLINETDTGIEFLFTCTVTDASVTDASITGANVTSEPSQPVSIIPTATTVP